MNIPVTYPLALLLCENLYDIPTDSLYVNNTLIDTNGRKCNWNREEDYEGFPMPISAPTIADVVMWLREKHSIWIEVIVESPNYFGYSVCNIKNNTSQDSDYVSYNSPTEAYEAAILYTLTNLI